MKFINEEINFALLQQRAFNLRWATVPKGVIPLTAADPDFPCAPEIAEALQQFAVQRYFSYAPPEGYSFFREAVANFYTIKRKVPTQPKQVIAVDSAAYGIDIVCKALLAKGDEAIVFNPVDFLFKYCVEVNDGVAVSFDVPLAADGVFNFEALESLITHKTKLICLCNPLNPTGKVFTKEELLQLGNIAVKHQLFILSDEIWSDIVFEPNNYTSVAAVNSEIQQQTIIVTGYSKSYGLAGLRAGTVIAPNDIMFEKLFLSSGHLSTVHGCNVMAQVAVSTALNECARWLNNFVEHLTNMRNICVESFNNMKGITCCEPQGCYLLFPDITATTLTASELQQLLLDKAMVAVVPGLSKWFGPRAEGHIRISFATSEEIIRESMHRIASVINEL